MTSNMRGGLLETTVFVLTAFFFIDEYFILLNCKTVSFDMLHEELNTNFFFNSTYPLNLRLHLRFFSGFFSPSASQTCRMQLSLHKAF